MYRSVGAVDPDGIQTIANAYEVGFEDVEAYIFPDSSAGDAATQVLDTLEALRKNPRMPSIIWLDIEGPNMYWSSDLEANEAFIQDLINTLESNSNGGEFSIGIYTSESQWSGIVPRGSTLGTGLPLWYAAYNGDPTFSGWRPFAVWSKPSRHQYSPSGGQCGGNYDVNWQPPGSNPATTSATATTHHTTVSSSGISTGSTGSYSSGVSGTISYGGVSTSSD